MQQSTSVWFIIVLALITANLPFAVQRPLLWLPWGQVGDKPRPVWLRWIASLLFFSVLGGTAYLFYQQIGDALSGWWFATLVAAYLMATTVLLAIPGWRMQSDADAAKSFVVRMLELLVLYGLCGTLAMALEQNLGNRFPQTWEFYAITGSLYMVFGYPGFVLRYLLRKPRRRRVQSADRSAGTSTASSLTA